jgi:uncharacterized protein YciI
MPYFAVTRERGPAWDALRAMRAQEKWAEHAAFMNALADERFIVLGGPVGEAGSVLFLVDAESEEAIHARLAADPWTPMGLLCIRTIERWELLLGDVDKVTSPAG